MLYIVLTVIFDTYIIDMNKYHAQMHSHVSDIHLTILFTLISADPLVSIILALLNCYLFRTNKAYIYLQNYEFCYIDVSEITKMILLSFIIR